MKTVDAAVYNTPRTGVSHWVSGEGGLRLGADNDCEREGQREETPLAP